MLKNRSCVNWQREYLVPKQREHITWLPIPANQRLDVLFQLTRKNMCMVWFSCIYANQSAKTPCYIFQPLLFFYVRQATIPSAEVQIFVQWTAVYLLGINCLNLRDAQYFVVCNVYTCNMYSHYHGWILNHPYKTIVSLSLCKCRNREGLQYSLSMFSRVKK